MFIGTKDKMKSDQYIPIKVECFDNLRLPTSTLPNALNLLLLEKGGIYLKTGDKFHSFFAPLVLCLRSESILTSANHMPSTMKLLSFLPNILNQNIMLETLDKFIPNSFAEFHTIFQLLPFLKSDISQSVFKIPPDIFHSICNITNKLNKVLMNQPTWQWRYYARSNLISIITLIESTYKDLFPTESEDAAQSITYPDALKKSLLYIHEHINEKITLDILAQNAWVSKTKIKDLFEEYLHTNFLRYLNEQRLLNVSKYIVEDELTITDVAFLTGFSPPHFSRFIKNMTGMTAKEYRKSCKLIK